MGAIVYTGGDWGNNQNDVRKIMEGNRGNAEKCILKGAVVVHINLGQLKAAMTAMNPMYVFNYNDTIGFLQDVYEKYDSLK